MLTVTFDKAYAKRYGVTSKQLNKWEEEYKLDVKEGILDLCRYDKLRDIHKLLYDPQLQRKYRKCFSYKIIDKHTFEGILKSNKDKIKILYEAPKKGPIKSINIYVNEKLLIECSDPKIAVKKIKEYLNAV